MIAFFIGIAIVEALALIVVCTRAGRLARIALQAIDAIEMSRRWVCRRYPQLTQPVSPDYDVGLVMSGVLRDTEELRRAVGRFGSSLP